MMNSRAVVESLSSSDLLSATRELVQRSRGLEADLLVHLGEIDERKLYLDWAFSSMFAFCVGELGFSEDAAYNRINLARAARRMPLILEVEELVARLSPQPPVPTVVRRLPDRATPAPEALPSFSFGTATQVALPESSPPLAFAPAPPLRRDEHRAVIAPLAEETFKFQFTASRACRDKLRQAQDLLRHRIPDRDVGTIFEKALDLLIERVKKERFATSRKARQAPDQETDHSCSRHIPDAIKREVFERDHGRCTFEDERGRRCAETGALEFDHRDGFARTRLHRADRIRLLCRAHNQHAAEQMYGREFMQRARIARTASKPSADSFGVNLTRCGPPRGELEPGVRGDSTSSMLQGHEFDERQARQNSIDQGSDEHEHSHARRSPLAATPPCVGDFKVSRSPEPEGVEPRAVLPNPPTEDEPAENDGAARQHEPDDDEPLEECQGHGQR